MRKIINRYKGSDWYDCCHIHPSLSGVNGRDIVWMIKLEKTLGKIIDSRGLIHQRWIFIDINDSDMDAVYFHSKNPNADNFPYRFKYGRIKGKNKKEYFRIIKEFSKHGYIARKIRGFPGLFAMNAQKVEKP